MPEKILFVDDEPQVLEGYKRLLHREFIIDTAVSGEDALTLLRGSSYSVVVSDMRMPGMNGAEFLAFARQQAPDTVRMLLTGYTDLNAAIAAVNEGNIFRFLTKPCEKPILVNAVSAGIEQYKLVIAEKELLEKTLMGSIKALSEVLSATRPEAFGRSLRITRYVRGVAERLQLSSLWRFEAAAMLSQLGCVALDQALINSSYRPERLPANDRERFFEHPRIAEKLLSHIPRLEPIVWMIGQQFAKDCTYTGSDLSPILAEEISLGAKILKLAIAFDNLRTSGQSYETVIGSLRARKGEFDGDLIKILMDIQHEAPQTEVRKLPVYKLATGMILQQDIYIKQDLVTREGMLLVPKGHEITQALLMKLENFARAGEIEKEVLVLVPVKC